jgi:UDP-glucose 4-epimerase
LDRFSELGLVLSEFSSANLGIEVDMTQSQETRETVLVTGISGAFGTLVAKKLSRHFNVMGVDRRPLSPLRNVEHHQLDLRRKSAYELLRKKRPQSIIHLGVLRNPLKHQRGSTANFFNLEITSQLLRLAEEIQVRKFIFLSTANLYGPSATSSGFLSEDAPLHGADRSPEIHDLVTIDMMIQSFFWKRPEIETIILRPVHLVGPHLNNAPTRFLRLERVPTILGFDPLIQGVHEDDAARAVLLALNPQVRGIFNIIGQDAAPLSRIVSVMKKTQFPIPEFLFRGFLRAAFKLNMTSFPEGELDHLKYSCLVDGSRAERDLKFKAQHSLKKTINDLL